MNKLLIDSELAGAINNIEYAKIMYKQKHRNKALKALKDAQQSLDFIHWHIHPKSEKKRQHEQH